MSYRPTGGIPYRIGWTWAIGKAWERTSATVLGGLERGELAFLEAAIREAGR